MQAHIQKDYSFLPKIILEISEIIGMEYAIKVAALANVKGKNISVYFPEKPKANHILSIVLPLDKIMTLSSHYRGETLIIPQTKKVDNILKLRQIKHLYSRGYSVSKIIDALKMPKTTVYRCLEEFHHRMIV